MIIILLILFLSFTEPVGAVQESGGTNFVLYDLGAYGSDPTEVNIKQLDNQQGIKTVIGAYDLNPAKVKSQLRAMCLSGQKKVGMMIWFSRFAPYPQTTPMYNLVPDQTYTQADAQSFTNSTGGKLQPRTENNLRGVVRDIAESGCFNEIQFRFAPTWYSFIDSWMGKSVEDKDWNHPENDWSETVYQENRNFVKYVREVIQSTLVSKRSAIKVFYDLGAELGGTTYSYLVPNNDPLKDKKVSYYDNLVERYQRQMWKDYVREFGVDDSYGFSIALAPGRFTKLMAMYDAVGIRPKQHAIDIYDTAGTGMESQLESLAGEMRTAGEIRTPILVQETYYKDSRAGREIVSAEESLKSSGFTIRAIMQWQLDREKMYRADGSFRHFATVGNDYIYYGKGTPTGSISCIPSTFNLAENQLGKSEVRALTDNLMTGVAQVCVETDGGTKKEMVTIPGSSADSTTQVPWIAGGKNYVFTLFQISPGAKCIGNVLASCAVTGRQTTPTSTATKIQGDYNGDQKVTLVDFGIWKTNYLAGKSTLVEFGVFKKVYLGN